MNDDARCPRCGEAFHCGVNDPEPCACTRIALDATVLADLRTYYRGCLCMRCLAAVVIESVSPVAPARPD